MTDSDFTIEHLAPEALAANPLNFRRHPENQAIALSASLEEHGWLSAPIFNRQTGHLLDGHARVEWAVGREERIPVRVVDVPEDQEQRILRAFDRIGAMALVDEEALDRLIGEIGDTDLERLLGELEEEPVFDPVGEDEQGRLDEKARVTCPECGHQFAA